MTASLPLASLACSGAERGLPHPAHDWRVGGDHDPGRDPVRCQGFPTRMESLWRIRINCPTHGEQVRAVAGGLDYIRQHYPKGTSVCAALELIPGRLNRICGATVTVRAERATWEVVEFTGAGAGAAAP